VRIIIIIIIIIIMTRRRLWSVERTLRDVHAPLEQNVVYNSRAIRFNRLDFMNAPKLDQSTQA